MTSERGWGGDALGHLPGLSMSPSVQTKPSVLCLHVSDPFRQSWLCTTNPMECVLTWHGHTAHLTSAFSGLLFSPGQTLFRCPQLLCPLPSTAHSSIPGCPGPIAVPSTQCCRALSTHPTAQASLKDNAALGAQRVGSASPISPRAGGMRRHRSVSPCFPSCCLREILMCPCRQPLCARPSLQQKIPGPGTPLAAPAAPVTEQPVPRQAESQKETVSFLFSGSIHASSEPFSRRWCLCWPDQMILPPFHACCRAPSSWLASAQRSGCAAWQPEGDCRRQIPAACHHLQEHWAATSESSVQVSLSNASPYIHLTPQRSPAQQQGLVVAVSSVCS